MDGDITGYNWQTEANSDSFLSWFIPTLLVNTDKFEEFSETTDRWQNIDIGITINGVPVPSRYFIEGVERNMRYFAERRGQEIVRENARLSEVDDIIENITSRVRNAINEAVRNTELADWNDDDHW